MAGSGSAKKKKKTKSKNEEDFSYYPEIGDPDFEKKIYMKKEFRDLIAVKERRTIQELCTPTKFELQKPQVFLRNYISSTTPYRGILVFWATGVGKCFRRGTKIMLHDGSHKAVEQITLRDKIMGDDSTPRNVLSLAHGKDVMYKIRRKTENTYSIPHLDEYVVNSEHILSLKHIDTLEKVDIKVTDYLALPSETRDKLWGYRVKVNYPAQKNSYPFVNPYYLGKDLLAVDRIPPAYLYGSEETRTRYLSGLSYHNRGSTIRCGSRKGVHDVVTLCHSLGYDCKLVGELQVQFYPFENDGMYPISVEVDTPAGFCSEGTRTARFDPTGSNQPHAAGDRGGYGDPSFPAGGDRGGYGGRVVPQEYFGFAVDGNHRFLLSDCTVVHNSCAAITVAEGFKSDKYFDRKTVILTDIQEQFKTQIFKLDYIKGNLKMLENQCTGDKYALTDDEMKFLTMTQKIDLIKKRIKENYNIIGPIAFANQVKRDISPDEKHIWDGNKKNLTTEMKQRIKQLYSNCVLIIDEVQNIKTTIIGEERVEQKIVPPVIEAVIRYADNIRLVLMSATPMFDKAEEILYIINLLLINDRRKPLKTSQIFDSNHQFVPGGEELLREACRGYISFYYGKNPIAYPVRVYPKEAYIPKPIYHSDGSEIKPLDRIRYSKLIMCPMGPFQEKWYQHYTNRETGRTDERYLTNIIFPNKEGKGIYRASATSGSGMNVVYDDFPSGKGTFLIKTTRNRFKYFEYKQQAIINKNETILSLKHLGNYSSKFEKMIENIIAARGGISLVYSVFNWIGVIPICLALEQNGFVRYTRGTNEPPLLKHNKPEPICYYCSKPQSADVHAIPEGEGKKAKVSDKKHKFYPSYYIIATADATINQRSPVEVAELVNKKENMDGRMIKVVVGNQVISEGIDFKRLRQIHITEPWYNLSKIEQIVGRADRNCSHVDLPEDQRNVEIYMYAVQHSTNSSKKVRETETYDEKVYALAENKDVNIKKVERILKEEAVDCALNVAVNQMAVDTVVKQTTVTGEVVKVSLAGEPYTAKCDYMDTCSYKCRWTPGKGDVDAPLDVDTYRLPYSQRDINKTLKIIKRMYKEDVIYDLDAIVNTVKSELGEELEDLIIYNALDKLLNSHQALITDRYDREGFLIYRGKYYVFQPLELEDERIPVYYRRKMLTVKPESVDLSTITYNLPPPEQSGKPKTGTPTGAYGEELGDVYAKMVKTMGKYEPILLDLAEKLKVTNIGKYILDIACARLNTKERIALLSEILVKKELSGLDKQIIEFFRHSLFFGQGKMKDRPVAFVVVVNGEDKFYGLDKNNERVTECATDNIAKLKLEYKKRPPIKPLAESQFTKIYGILTKKRDKIVFKVADQTQYTEQITRNDKPSGRSKITGKVCTSFLADDIKKIVNHIGLKISDFSKYKRDICLQLEFVFRVYEDRMYQKVHWIRDETELVV